MPLIEQQIKINPFAVTYANDGRTVRGLRWGGGSVCYSTLTKLHVANAIERQPTTIALSLRM